MVGQAERVTDLPPLHARVEGFLDRRTQGRGVFSLRLGQVTKALRLLIHLARGPVIRVQPMQFAGHMAVLGCHVLNTAHSRRVLESVLAEDLVDLR